MRYVIWSTTQRKYVTPPGQHHSFTTNINKAHHFATKVQAEGECCGDEIVREFS